MSSERGSAALVVMAVLVLVSATMVGVARLGAAAADRAGAQAAADAAALAGATAGRDAAADLAARNGATLVSYQEVEPDVEVTVERDGVRAVARARGVTSPIP